MNRLWKRLAGEDDSFVSDARRFLRVGWRSGLFSAQRPAGLVTGARLLLHQPLGPGIIHALNARNAPHDLGVEDGPVRLTHREVDIELNRLVHGLHGMGLGRGDRLLLMAPNGWPYLLGFFSALRGGFAAVHASYRLTTSELRALLYHSEPKCVLFDPRCWQAVSGALEAHPSRRIQWIATGSIPGAPEIRTLSNLLAGQPDSFPRERSRLKRMPNLVYTSGTTGAPKGAVRDFARMSLPELMRILDRLPFQAKERHLVVCPLYHSAAQAFVTLQAAGCATLVFLPRFDPEETLACLANRGIHSVFLVPTMIRRILQLPAAVKARHRPALRLRCLVSGAAPFPQSLREEAMDYFGDVVHDFYGTTEVGWATLVSSSEMRDRPHTLGRPIPGTRILILDEAGRPLPPLARGDIYVTTSQRIDEYYRDQRATERSRHGEAQATGDLGWLDEEGYLFLAGRSSDLIISGGVNIYPMEIEQVLTAHPAVREAAVLGLPHDTWGEEVAAVLVGPRPEDLPIIEAFCRERLAGFKVPRRWELLEELPRNPTGKVLKGALSQSLGASPGASLDTSPGASPDTSPGATLDTSPGASLDTSPGTSLDTSPGT